MGSGSVLQVPGRSPVDTLCLVGSRWDKGRPQSRPLSKTCKLWPSNRENYGPAAPQAPQPAPSQIHAWPAPERCVGQQRDGNLLRNPANGCRGVAIHIRIGQTAAEGSHFSCPWGQNGPNGCRGEAVHRRIGLTAAEGSHFSCPWPSPQRRSLASDSKAARDRRAGHAKYEWTDTLVALLIGRPMDRNRNCGAVVAQSVELASGDMSSHLDACVCTCAGMWATT